MVKILFHLPLSIYCVPISLSVMEFHRSVRSSFKFVLFRYLNSDSADFITIATTAKSASVFGRDNSKFVSSKIISISMNVLCSGHLQNNEKGDFFRNLSI